MEVRTDCDGPASLRDDDVPVQRYLAMGRKCCSGRGGVIEGRRGGEGRRTRKLKAAQAKARAREHHQRSFLEARHSHASSTADGGTVFSAARRAGATSRFDTARVAERTPAILGSGRGKPHRRLDYCTTASASSTRCAATHYFPCIHVLCHPHMAAQWKAVRYILLCAIHRRPRDGQLWPFVPACLVKPRPFARNSRSPRSSRRSFRLNDSTPPAHLRPPSRLLSHRHASSR